jgi:5'-3' exonuclease
MKLHILIDGHNLLFRSGHTTGQLTLSDGTPCGAAWGVVRSVLLAYKQEAKVCPATVHVVWDGGRSKRRLLLHPEYKAGRRGTKDDKGEGAEQRREEREQILAQAEMAREVLGLLGVYQYDSRGIEADDVISALVESLSGPDSTIVLLSNDEDFLQLLHKPGVIIQRATERVYRGDLIGHPLDYLSVKCLEGDKSDNVEGFPGVGPKTAWQILKFFGSAPGTEQPRDPTWLASQLKNLDPAGSQVLSAPGRLKTALFKVMNLPEKIEHNRKLMDLREPLGWEEVWEATVRPRWQPANFRQFQTQLVRLGWRGMAEQVIDVASKVAGI